MDTEWPIHRIDKREKADTVKVVSKKFEINDASFEFTFERIH